MSDANGAASKDEPWIPNQQDVKLAEHSIRHWVIKGKFDQVDISSVFAPGFLKRRIEVAVDIGFGGGQGGVRAGDTVTIFDDQLRKLWIYALITSVNVDGKTAVLKPIVPPMDLSGVERASINIADAVIEMAPDGYRVRVGHEILSSGHDDQRDAQYWLSRRSVA